MTFHVLFNYNFSVVVMTIRLTLCNLHFALTLCAYILKMG